MMINLINADEELSGGYCSSAIAGRERVEGGNMLPLSFFVIAT